MSKIPSDIHGSVLAEHKAYHDKLITQKKEWVKVLEKGRDYVSPEVINQVKQYNAQVTKNVNNHNMICADMAASQNLSFRRLKNIYTLPVPEIGKHVAAQMCQCKEEDETDFCQCKEEYCECPAEEEHCDCPPEAENAKVEAAMNALSINEKESKQTEAKGFITIDASMIPQEYKKVFLDD